MRNCTAKIVNDPVHGFITLPAGLLLDLINHPWLQRLRRIKQLGLTEYVYPGALHTRFHHALGAMHLMDLALETLSSKGHDISPDEWEAAKAAVLLHDVGHGPFSHALEYTILTNVDHEHITLLVMQQLVQELGGNMSLALQMFNDTYPRPFFHQLISGQLDVDRLDYLARDSFFTGVIEGGVASQRIIKMLNLVNDNLVVEEKAIYSIENFLVARRLMYWQVYLHKTTVSTEQMLVQLLRRARHLVAEGVPLQLADPLAHFFHPTTLLAPGEEPRIQPNDLQSSKAPAWLAHFLLLDDVDIWAAIKRWARHPDLVLSELCKALLERKLFKVLISDKPFDWERSTSMLPLGPADLSVQTADIPYLLCTGEINNTTYFAGANNIRILTKSGQVKDIMTASDAPHVQAMDNAVTKYYLCRHPRLTQGSILDAQALT
jgi:HD superfamily phosphohydrolase